MLDDELEGPPRETAPIVERARAFSSGAYLFSLVYFRIILRKAYRRFVLVRIRVRRIERFDVSLIFIIAKRPIQDAKQSAFRARVRDFIRGVPVA